MPMTLFFNHILKCRFDVTHSEKGNYLAAFVFPVYLNQSTMNSAYKRL